MYYIVYPPWSIADDPAGQPFASTALQPSIKDGREVFYGFDWDILIDLTARQLIADPLTHPMWHGAMRQHRYPLYTPNSRYVTNAASYTSRRSIAVGVRQIMLAMQLNINHIHIPQITLASSCYEHRCVDINHIVPFRTMPASQFTIDYTDPASGRPSVLIPAWEERDLVQKARQEIAAEKTRAAVASIGIDPKLLGLPPAQLPAPDEDDPTNDPHK